MNQPRVSLDALVVFPKSGLFGVELMAIPS